jgi:hypothetical protein
MSLDTRRQGQSADVYRCDALHEGAQCPRETAAFQNVDAVTVIVDPAWLVLRVGLGEEKYFCSLLHLAAWLNAGGEFVDRMMRAASDREEREHKIVEESRRRLEAVTRNGDIL